MRKIHYILFVTALALITAFFSSSSSNSFGLNRVKHPISYKNASPNIDYDFQMVIIEDEAEDDDEIAMKEKLKTCFYTDLFFSTSPLPRLSLNFPIPQNHFDHMLNKVTKYSCLRI